MCPLHRHQDILRNRGPKGTTRNLHHFGTATTFKPTPATGKMPTSKGVKQNEYKNIKTTPAFPPKGGKGGKGGGILLELTKPHKIKIHSIMYNLLTRGVLISGGDAVTAL